MLCSIRHTRALALFALLVMLGSVPVAVTALAHAPDDSDGGPILVLHDHNAHRIGGARPLAPEGQHCLVCHWLQSVQTLAAAARVAAPAADCLGIVASARLIAPVTSTAIVAARAPPSAL